MNPCKICGGPMSALFTGTFCPKNCDRVATTAAQSKPFVVEMPWYKQDLVGKWQPEVPAYPEIAGLDKLILGHFGPEVLSKTISAVLPPTTDCLYGDKTRYNGKMYTRENKNYWLLELPVAPARCNNINWACSVIDDVRSFLVDVRDELKNATKSYKEVLTLGSVPHWVMSDGRVANRVTDRDTVELRLRAFWTGVPRE